MKRIGIILAALLAFPASLGARKDSGSNLNARLNGGITAGSTLAATRTATFSSGELTGFGLLLLYVEITDADDSETGVSLECTAQPVSGKKKYRIPTCVFDNVTTRFDCEEGPLFWNPSDETAADTKLQVFRVDVEGLTNASCAFAFTGGAAADSIEVVAFGAVKG